MVEFNELIDKIQEEIAMISKSAGLPDGFLTLIENKGESRSLWIVEPLSKRKSKMILSTETKGRKGQKYLSVIVKAAKISSFETPECAELVPDPNDTAVCRLNFKQIDEEITAYLHDLIQSYVNQFEPSDKFGCCHRYRECSSAGKCIHPDQFYSKACWYRKNLEDGRIFY